ncbi:MAG: hypothetical protein ACREBD_15960 [Blastocatellia bacterium]
MTQQKAQTGTALIHAPWRVLMRASVLLLLFTHQSWAGVFCDCTHQDESQHVCCHTAQHNHIAAEMHQEGLEAEASSHCESEEATTPDSQFENSQQSATICCYAAPQTDLQGVALTSPNPQTAEESFPLVHINARTIPATAYFNIHPQHHNRPLYLAFSCWLI